MADYRALCRKHAQGCLDLARFTADRDARQLLIARAERWLKLAYSAGDAGLHRALLAFNEEQMAGAARPAPTTRRTAIRQPAQQQQSRIRPDDNGPSDR